MTIAASTSLASAWKPVAGRPTRLNQVPASPPTIQVNTAKMVRHGAGRLLVELVTNTDPLKDADARKRASAAFRNILCVSVSRSQKRERSLREAEGRVSVD